MYKIAIVIIILIIILFTIFYIKKLKKETYVPIPNNFLEQNNLPDNLNFEQFKNHLKESYNQDADSIDYLKYMRLKSYS